VIHQKYLLLLSMTGVGIAWASTLSMPYAMLAGALPPRKVGVYMGIFNFFIVTPEILASVGFGWIMSHLLGNNRLAAVVCAAECSWPSRPCWRSGSRRRETQEERFPSAPLRRHTG